MFVSPVIYPSTIINAKNKNLVFLNPMQGLLNLVVQLCWGEYSLYAQGCILSANCCFHSDDYWYLFFLRQERTFADEL